MICSDSFSEARTKLSPFIGRFLSAAAAGNHPVQGTRPPNRQLPEKEPACRGPGKTILQLQQNYQQELVDININIVGLLALAMISTSAIIVFKYPNAFIISHTQVLKALELYNYIEEREGDDEPPMEAIVDYVSLIAAQLDDIAKQNERTG